VFPQGKFCEPLILCFAFAFFSRNLPTFFGWEDHIFGNVIRFSVFFHFQVVIFWKDFLSDRMVLFFGIRP